MEQNHEVKHHGENTLAYDAAGRIATECVQTDYGADGTQIGRARAYAYNGNGWLMQVSETQAGSIDPVVTTYSYDNVGNRLTKSGPDGVTTSTYNDLDQLTGSETVLDNAVTSRTTCTYDAAGNQITQSDAVTGESLTMTYDPENWMTGLEKQQGSTVLLSQTNRYNGDGQRIRRDEIRTATDPQTGQPRQETGQTNYFYQDGTVLYRTDGTNQKDFTILGLEENPVAVSSIRGTDEDWVLYDKDIRISTTSILNEDGGLAAQYDYDEYGNTEILEGADFDNEVCYTGQIYDRNTGLYYYNARYYAPETGRFTTQDTYRGEQDEEDTYHLYAYCANDPVNYADSGGHVSIPNWVYSYLERKTLTRAMKMAIRTEVSACASVYLNRHGYTLSRKMFNHALWKFGRPAGKSIKKTLRKRLHKSKKFKKEIRKHKKKGASGSLAFNKGDLYYSIHWCNYYILKAKKKKVTVLVWDWYNFDSLWFPLTKVGSVANDLGYLLEKMHVSYPYLWRAKVKIKV